MVRQKQAEDKKSPANKPKKRWGKIVLLPLLTILVLGTISALAYGYLHEKKEKERLSNPTEAAKQENKDLIAKTGQLVELPNEEPTIATVKDVSKLQNQTFFKNAQNGDKVLIFTQSKKAVLYRPSTNKIVEVAPINLGDNEQAKTENKTETKAETPPQPETPPVQ